MDNDWRQLDFLTAKQIAKILGIHSNTAYDLVNKLPHIKIGKSYRVSRLAFEKWIKDQERMNARA